MGLIETVADKTQVTDVHAVYVSVRKPFQDPKAVSLLRSIRQFLHLNIDDLSIIRLYLIKKRLSKEAIHAIASNLLQDQVTENLFYGDFPLDGDWTVHVSLKPGITDTSGKIAQLTFEDFLKQPFSGLESIKSSVIYVLQGRLSKKEVESIAKELLGNPLIEEITIRSSGEFSKFWGISREPDDFPQPKVETVPISDATLQTLEAISKQRQLALNLSEMLTLKNYYSNTVTKTLRKSHDLPENPTDVEMEVFAQTWSEHCKHKIFNARIHYRENGKSEQIAGLFQTYIKKATEEISASIPWLVSVFSDNAGIIQFNRQYHLSFKVETHNSPSALDPFGGAITGILGVNRDIMGAGVGCRLLANTNVLCFASPDYAQNIPPRLMHPRRIMEGVCRGIEHGGNKSGIPTVNGSITFDDRFLGKPLVYCGSIGIMPAMINSVPSHSKEIHPGDFIIIAGGRTGKDGIHGATFSSEALKDDSPLSAVQIGDPFTQKKLQDFLLEARDAGLYRTLTDNGAGGFSSSIGELSSLSGGCEIHLDRAILKQQGMEPWEILLSESQERMTLAVPKENERLLFELAKLHEIELVNLGAFTNKGYFHVYYNQKTIALIPLEFLHHGLPVLNLEAEWDETPDIKFHEVAGQDFNHDLHELLSRLNICSKESIVRQYDHEVQGTSVIKPFVGIANDGPSDAAVICPTETAKTYEGVVISHGICPRYGYRDAYRMAANAIDEAIRNAICVGADPGRIAILDNFCWPDPIYDPVETPDGKKKLGQLVRANKALYFYAKAFMTPVISGKDSMKNDYKIGNIKISVPPTLLISAIGKIKDVRKAVTMDVKKAGDLVYLIGITKDERGASEYALMKNIEGGCVPEVDPKIAKRVYDGMHRAIEAGLIASCHDCSEGGMAVALAETSFSGGLGLEILLSEIPTEGAISEAALLFSESSSRFIVSIDPLHKNEFEKCLPQHLFGRIGTVRYDSRLTIAGKNGSLIVDTDIHSLKKSWQKPFKDPS